MKNLILTAVCVLFTVTAFGQSMEIIPLEQPDMERGGSLMQALKERKSTREFSSQQLSIQDLSDLLWAATGVNREDGRMTAPTAKNAQEISVYCCSVDGAYLYDKDNHRLIKVTDEDIRPLLAQSQEFVLQAPVCLLIVADHAKFSDGDQFSMIAFSGTDAGMVSQNISLFCASAGLVTVPRGWMDREAVSKALELREDQMPYLNHPVGYSK